VVVAFDVLGRSNRWYWLVIATDEVSICRHDTGSPTDVTITGVSAGQGLNSSPEWIRTTNPAI
jgi:hypothetical protein